MRLLRSVLIFFCILISFKSYADFSANQCTTLNRNDDFSIWFKLTPANLQETIYATKRNGSSPLAIWTNDPSVTDSDITDSVTQNGSNYDVWLTYESLNNKSGTLIYYLSDNGVFTKIDEQIADLSNISAAISIVGDETEELQCDDGITAPPTYSSDAQYEFGTKQCTSMPCTIDFNKTYDYAPLVFVMPTVDTVTPDQDKPATLVITSDITSDSSSVVINKATANLLDYPNDVAITEVSYLIIEPGVADFDGHEVIAGYVDTDITKSVSHSDGIAVVDYADFGRQTDFDNPVVLHQIQTRNNGSKWQTSGKVWSNSTKNQQARLYLELSNTGSGSYDSERIAFLATNEEDGLDVQGYNVEFNKDFVTRRQGTAFPLERGCSYYEETDLDNIDGVIANKQRRAGSDGGWARRCRIDGDEFSVVIDEDSDDRTHVPEEIGYFSFENKELETDLCVYFPEPAQSWESDGELNLRSANITIEGWSEAYEAAYLSGNELIVAFENTENTNSDYHLANSCVTSTGTVDCVLKSGSTPPLANIPIDLSPTWGTRVLTVDNWNFETVCSGLSECETSTVDGQRVLTIKESLDELTVSAYGQSIKTVFEATSGSYGISIDEYLSDGAVLNYFQANSRYTFGEFSYSGTGATFSSETGVVINIEDSYSQSNAVPFYDIDGTRDLIFYGPDAELTFRTQDGSDIIAQILADEVEFTNLSTVRGAITSNKLIFNVEGSKIIGEGACLNPSPSTNYEIVLTPSTDIALTCEDLSLTATVYKDDAVHTSYSGDITLFVDGDEEETIAATSGVSEFSLSVTQTSSVSAEVATTINSTTYTDDGSYDFVPYKFDVPEQYLIAEKSESVTAKVLACDSGEVVDVGYSGTPTITSNMVQPSSGSGTLTYAPIFSGGTSTDESSSIEFSESGQLTVTLTDRSFNCVDYDDCPMEGQDELTGSFTVNSRPWTFAICSDDDVSGNADGGIGYQAAGTTFATTVKPIVWQTDGSESEPVDTASYCDAMVTQNFFISDAPNAVVVMTNELDTPVTGNSGTLSGLPDPGMGHDSNTNGSDYYNFANLSWDEVGSIRLLVDTQTSYLGMDINQGYRNIGRFYPAHLAMISNDWNYASNHSAFAYMAQETSFGFIVEARNSSNNSVDNYGLFTETLKASVGHIAIDEDDSVLNMRIWLSGSPDADSVSWGGDNWSSARLTIDNIGYEFLRLASEDGPYDDSNSEFGLWVSDKVDGVDLQNLDLINNNDGYTDGTKFTSQPDFRYGRMSLTDVGGNQGSNIKIPLEVQYWSGSQFVINSDDNGSQFNGSDFCVIKIWDTAESTDAKLTSDADDNGSDDIVSVSDGVSSDLIAKQVTSRREQVRLFLRQGSSPSDASCEGSVGTQPWLQYNWRGLGDEDPSTVVTFGIHRGNDRVIYRGETGLTGQ